LGFLEELHHSESIKGAMGIEILVHDFSDIRFDAGIRDNSKDGEIV